MDLNYALTWMVGLSSLLVLARSVQTPQLRASFEVRFSALLLGCLALGVWLIPHIVGLITGGLWGVFLITPGMLAGQIRMAVATQRYTRVVRLARLLSWLHPSKRWRQEARAFEWRALVQLGRDETAERLLEQGPDNRTKIVQRLEILSVRRDFSTVIDTIHASAERSVLEREALPLYLRALGEEARFDEMMQVFERHLQARRRVPASTGLMVLIAAAMWGCVDITDRLARALLRHRRDADDMHAYWLATALQRAGRQDEAALLLEPLAGGDDLQLQRAITHRLEHPLTPAPPMSPTRDTMVHELAKGLIELFERQPALIRPVDLPQSGHTPVTYAVLGVLITMFLVEIPGGTTDVENLVRLGALVGPDMFRDEIYWRAITAGVLHFGLTHLLFNLLGLWFFGRPLERIHGAWRFLTLYVLSSAGAMWAIWMHAQLWGGERFVLVGASAGLMGLVGGHMAHQLHMWRQQGSIEARKRLSLLALVVAMQSIFDVVTPAVSFAAHAGGLVLGFVLGTMFERSRAAHPDR